MGGGDRALYVFLSFGVDRSVFVGEWRLDSRSAVTSVANAFVKSFRFRGASRVVSRGLDCPMSLDRQA